MRSNFWTVFWIGIAFLVLVFGVIPAVFQWQKNNHDHDEKMMDKAIELEVVKHGREEPSTKRNFLNKVAEFVGKTIKELAPTIAGKVIGEM